MADSAPDAEASLPEGPPATPAVWCCRHTRAPGLGSASHQGAELGSSRVSRLWAAGCCAGVIMGSRQHRPAVTVSPWRRL